MISSTAAAASLFTCKSHPIEKWQLASTTISAYDMPDQVGTLIGPVRSTTTRFIFL